MSLTANTSSELANLGVARLGGALEAAVHLTHRAQPPDDPEAIAAERGEIRDAVASLVVRASAGATFDAPASALGISAGASAAGRLAFAHHRRYDQGTVAVEALRELLENLLARFEHERRSLSGTGRAKVGA